MRLNVEVHLIDANQASVPLIQCDLGERIHEELICFKLVSSYWGIFKPIYLIQSYRSNLDYQSKAKQKSQDTILSGKNKMGQKSPKIPFRSTYK